MGARQGTETEARWVGLDRFKLFILVGTLFVLIPGALAGEIAAGQVGNGGLTLTVAILLFLTTFRLFPLVRELATAPVPQRHGYPVSVRTW